MGSDTLYAFSSPKGLPRFPSLTLRPLKHSTSSLKCSLPRAKLLFNDNLISAVNCSLTLVLNSAR